jgi:hypothetical protein
VSSGLDRPDQVGSSGHEDYVLIESLGQVSALGFVGDARGTTGGEDHPSGCAGPLDEELPRVFSGDVVGHHVVAAEMDIGRAVAGPDLEELVLCLLAHDEGSENLEHAIAATGGGVTVNEPLEGDLDRG